MAYAMTEEEIVLVTNFVEGSNLDSILFGKKSLKEVRDIMNHLIIIMTLFFMLTMYSLLNNRHLIFQGKLLLPFTICIPKTQLLYIRI